MQNNKSNRSRIDGKQNQQEPSHTGTIPKKKGQKMKNFDVAFGANSLQNSRK